MTIVRMGRQQLPAAGSDTYPPTVEAADISTATASNGHVDVDIDGAKTPTELGSAPVAEKSSAITSEERQTIEDADQGAQMLGLTAHGEPQLTVHLRNTNANDIGPNAAADDTVNVPTTNVIGAWVKNAGYHVKPTDQLFGKDVTLHELSHEVQFGAILSAGNAGILDAYERESGTGGDLALVRSAQGGGGSSSTSADDTSLLGPTALMEGMADADAAAITQDWSIGEGYFGPGSDITSIRDIAHPNDSKALNPIETNVEYAKQAVNGTLTTRTVDGVQLDETDPHVLGGVVSRAVYAFEQKQGWHQAQVLIDTLNHDPQIWQEGGTFDAFEDRFLAVANEMEPHYPGALDAARSALRSVGYSVSDTDTGSKTAPPELMDPMQDSVPGSGDAPQPDTTTPSTPPTGPSSKPTSSAPHSSALLRDSLIGAGSATVLAGVAFVAVRLARRH